MNNIMSVTKKVAILLFLALGVAALSLYWQMQTSRGTLHPIFAALKLISTEQANEDFIQALESAEPKALDEYRQKVAQFYRLSGDVTFSGSIEQQQLNLNGHPLGIRVYSPAAAQNQAQRSAKKSVIVYYHGGGWSSGNINMIAKMAKHLANVTNAVVVTPEYRLAPEYPYPAAFNDAYGALQWVTQQARRRGWDGNRILVAGDSAGGNLAAAVALYSRDHQGPELAGQILIYPDMLPLSHDFDSQLQAIALPPNAAFITATGKVYAGNTDADDPYLSPLAAQHFHRLPPALVITAGFDLLTAESLAYAQKMQNHGVTVETLHYPEVGHGFFSMVAMLDETEAAVQGINTFMQTQLD